MKNNEPTMKRMSFTRRKAVVVSGEDLVRTMPLQADNPLPLVVEPAIDELNVVEWANNNGEFINSHLAKHGGILFRNFHVNGVDGFEEFVNTTSDGLLEYRERSSPRSQVSGRIYTSTDYPADQPIFLHNENSYQAAFPLKIYFFCVTPPNSQGETPIADCRRIYQRIAPEIRDRFAEKKIMYLRNFGDGFGLSWQTVFQTDDKEAVEAHCRANGIICEWQDDNRLRTRAIRPAVARHPLTSDVSWFNHGTFFHISTLPEAIREGLLAEFGETDLPSNTAYGDGSPIESEVLEHLREIYQQETVSFPWQKGDILMLDNMMVAHGRSSYEGPRKIVTGMAEPYRWEDVSS